VGDGREVRLRRFLLYLISIAFLLGSGFAKAGPAADTISLLIGYSFRAQSQRVTNLQIKPIRSWELALASFEADATEHNVIKFMLSHWKFWTQVHLLWLAQASDSVEDWEAIIGQLSELGYAIDKESVGILTERFERLRATHWGYPQTITKNFALLLATQGDPSAVHPILDRLGYDYASRLAGPRTQVEMGPIDPHPRWRSDGWLNLPEMDRYVWQNGEVVYRGVRFRAGDLLLVDLNKLFDGFNTSLTAERHRSNFTHNGIVLFWQQGGKTIPVVFEICAAGLRIVPLARYLSPDFVLYAEVHRLRDSVQRPADWSLRLQAAAAELLRHQLGYDFNAHLIPEGGVEVTWGGRPPGVVCSSLVRVLYNYTHIRGVDIPQTPLAPGSRENIRRGGLTALADAGEYVDPTALKMTPQHRRVGVIDNGFLRNVLRERLQGGAEVPGSMGYLMNHLTLDPGASDRFLLRGLRYLVTGIAAMAQSKDPIVGGAVRLFLHRQLGMVPAAIPQAPPASLGLVVTFNHAIEGAAYLIGRSAKRGLPELARFINADARSPIDCSEWVAQLGARVPFHLGEVETRDGIVRTFGEALQRTGARSYFRAD